VYGSGGRLLGVGESDGDGKIAPKRLISHG
jgi:Pseudouridine synthase II TruB, C-terminal